jgi:hypothetical protein
MIVADTDGILDLCYCGARAGFSESDGRWQAGCTECAEGTLIHPCSGWAMAAWNKRMRVIKSEKGMR